MTSYAHDTTPFFNGTNLLTVLNDIEIKAFKALIGFLIITLRHPDKSNLWLTSKEEISIKIENCIINSTPQKALMCHYWQ